MPQRMAKAKPPAKPKRPADAAQRAIMIGRIVTGEDPDPRRAPPKSDDRKPRKNK
jgi:hypothetical protein